MNKTQVGEHFLIVNKFISKKDNELATGYGNNKVNPIAQNLATTFNSNIYIKFIPNDVTEDELKTKFTIPDSKIVSIKLQKFTRSVNGNEIQPYQYAFVLYDTVQAAQRAIQLYDQSQVFGTKNILVELWVSKEDKEAERKKKESQQLHQFLNNIMSLTKAQSYPPGQY
jgi:RNA recognition motif-containing protein